MSSGHTLFLTLGTSAITASQTMRRDAVIRVDSVAGRADVVVGGGSTGPAGSVGLGGMATAVDTAAWHRAAPALRTRIGRLLHTTSARELWLMCGTGATAGSGVGPVANAAAEVIALRGQPTALNLLVVAPIWTGLSEAADAARFENFAVIMQEIKWFRSVVVLCSADSDCVAGDLQVMAQLLAAKSGAIQQALVDAEVAAALRTPKAGPFVHVAKVGLTTTSAGLEAAAEKQARAACQSAVAGAGVLDAQAELDLLLTENLGDAAEALLQLPDDPRFAREAARALRAGGQVTASVVAEAARRVIEALDQDALTMGAAAVAVRLDALALACVALVGRQPSAPVAAAPVASGSVKRLLRTLFTALEDVDGRAEDQTSAGGDDDLRAALACLHPRLARALEPQVRRLASRAASTAQGDRGSRMAPLPASTALSVAELEPADEPCLMLPDGFAALDLVQRRRVVRSALAEARAIRMPAPAPNALHRVLRGVDLATYLVRGASTMGSLVAVHADPDGIARVQGRLRNQPVKLVGLRATDRTTVRVARIEMSVPLRDVPACTAAAAALAALKTSHGTTTTEPARQSQSC